MVVPARRAAYEGYRALPVYPTLIRGEFDPAAWAADPNRRADLFDAHRTAPAADTVVGSPASGGVVEGIARIVATVEEGEVIRPGEILVTTVTNIGWTPLFTRISAIVTDVPNLSHASIVARELGIPAVVGCGNATTRIRTGDMGGRRPGDGGRPRTGRCIVPRPLLTSRRCGRAGDGVPHPGPTTLCLPTYERVRCTVHKQEEVMRAHFHEAAARLRFAIALPPRGRPVERLSRLAGELARPAWTFPKPPRDLYVWGPVGRGKKPARGHRLRGSRSGPKAAPALPRLLPAAA